MKIYQEIRGGDLKPRCNELRRGVKKSARRLKYDYHTVWSYVRGPEITVCLKNMKVWDRE